MSLDRQTNNAIRQPPMFQHTQISVFSVVNLSDE
jgi:hypothetical protein